MIGSFHWNMNTRSYLSFHFDLSFHFGFSRPVAVGVHNNKFTDPYKSFARPNSHSPPQHLNRISLACQQIVAVQKALEQPDRISWC